MPKLKTHRGAAKRFKLTAKGKIKRRKATIVTYLLKKAPNVKEISLQVHILARLTRNR